MELTAVCITLVMNMWLLLVMLVQDSCFAQKTFFPRVVPNRHQHFEYESVSFSCEGFDMSSGWRLMRMIFSKNTACGSGWGVFNGSFCVLRNVYVDDSGQYWCETRDGKTSSIINISVSAGPVILDSPVHPVMEGETVTLRCKNKMASSSDIMASFSKNGLLIKTNVSTGNLIIQSVSKFDEGLYRCKISGAGDSPESWLTVREDHQETVLCSDQLPVLLYLLVRTVSTVVLVALLLLVMRKYQSHKEILS